MVEGVGSSVVEDSHWQCRFPSVILNSGFHNNPVLSVLTAAFVHHSCKPPCCTRRSLLVARLSFFLQSVVATPPVSLSDKVPVQIVLICNTQHEVQIFQPPPSLRRISGGLWQLSSAKPLPSGRLFLLLPLFKASAVNITFVLYLTAAILPSSGLLPDTTLEKHGRMMEWIL